MITWDEFLLDPDWGSHLVGLCEESPEFKAFLEWFATVEPDLAYKFRIGYLDPRDWTIIRRYAEQFAHE